MNYENLLQQRLGRRDVLKYAVALGASGFGVFLSACSSGENPAASKSIISPKNPQPNPEPQDKYNWKWFTARNGEFKILLPDSWYEYFVDPKGTAYTYQSRYPSSIGVLSFEIWKDLNKTSLDKYREEIRKKLQEGRRTMFDRPDVVKIEEFGVNIDGNSAWEFQTFVPPEAYGPYSPFKGAYYSYTLILVRNNIGWDMHMLAVDPSMGKKAVESIKFLNLQ